MYRIGESQIYTNANQDIFVIAKFPAEADAPLASIYMTTKKMQSSETGVTYDCGARGYMPQADEELIQQ